MEISRLDCFVISHILSSALTRSRIADIWGCRTLPSRESSPCPTCPCRPSLNPTARGGPCLTSCALAGPMWAKRAFRAGASPLRELSRNYLAGQECLRLSVPVWYRVGRTRRSRPLPCHTGPLLALVGLARITSPGRIPWAVWAHASSGVSWDGQAADQCICGARCHGIDRSISPDISYFQ